MQMILAIAAGGAIGAVMRYAVYGASFLAFGHGFPIGTMIVNIIGSFLMGAALALFDFHWQPSPELKLFITTGFLGAFTTFSNFSLDAYGMFEKGDVLHSILYVAGTVFFSILAFFAGLYMIKQVVA